jgi:large subunit ribosomal protein L4
LICLTYGNIAGQYEDLVARVTNFHNEDKGFMVWDVDVFDVPIRKDIVHRIVRWQLAKRQQVHPMISRVFIWM